MTLLSHSIYDREPTETMSLGARAKCFASMGVALLVGLTVVACGDVVAPPADGTVDAAKIRGRDFFGVSFTSATISVESEALTPTGGTTDTPDNPLEQATDAPPLQTYQTSFTHVQGETTIFMLSYRSDDELPDPFLFLTIPPDAEVFDETGKRVRKGKAVEITVEVNPRLFLLRFGPHGATFLRSRPAELWLNYEHANLSGQDPSNLGMCYQPTEGEPWTELDTTIDLYGNWARAEIYHFSNYAVAWFN